MAQNFVTALKKIARWSLWSAAGGMLLVTLLHFLLPLLLDGQMLKRKIQRRLDPVTYGRIDFDALRITLLPLPAVVATQVSYALPGRVQLLVEEVAVHPHLPSLLRGRLRLDTLRVQAPEAILDLPAAPQKSKSEPAPGPSRDPLTERLTNALARLPQDARVLLNDGRIILQREGTPLVRFEALTLCLVESGGRLDLDLTGGSDRVERLRVTARLDGRSLDGQGEMQLSGIRLDGPSEAGETPPGSARNGRMQVQGDLSLTLQTQGLQNLQATLRSELPAVTLARGKKWVRARQLTIEAEAQLDSQGLRATLSRLQVAQPRLNLDGRLAWDMAGTGDSSALQLDLNLRDTDATAVRALLVNMAGDGRPWKLWDIVGGGTLDEMTLHTEAETWRDLGRMGNLRIAGKASGAHIVVPGVGLDLAGVNGAWALDKGVLTVAPGATARHGGIQASNAALTVGLAEPPRAIDLSLDFFADLADLPALLKKVIPSEKAQAELARVGHTQGRATGKVRIEGTLQDLKVRVTARDITLAAEYDRLPLPVQIKGPELTYTDGQIRFKQMGAGMGASSLTAVSGRIAWQPEPTLSLQGRSARFSGDELFPWLSALPALRAKTAGLQSIAGALQWTDFAIGGPLARPGPWQFQGAGAFDTLIVGLTNITEPFTLGAGRFGLATTQTSKPEVRLDIRQLNLSCAEQRAGLSGTILFGAKKVRPALALSAERLDLGRIVPLFKSSPPVPPKSGPPPKKKPDTAIDGRVSVAIEQVVYGGYQWSPVRAEATVAQGQTILAVTQADLCGISTVGHMVWSDQGLSLEIKPSTIDPSAPYISGCLAGGASTERIEGTIDVQGKISATGRDMDALLASLGGELRLSARDGRILNVGRVGFFTNLLSFLSVNDIVKGEKFNLTQNDLPYKRIVFDFLIRNGVAELREANITSKPLNIVGEGKVDLTTRQIAIILLVSPLTTADAVVQRIPVVGKILQGTLVVVPVEVKGPFSDPSIVPMSPKAVGSRLMGIMERTLMAPLQLVEPIWRTPTATPNAAD
jgi:uncharacterized protein involved in outer membrane biogenesis